MANEVKLEVYTFSIRALNSSKENPSYCNLSEIHNRIDFFNCLKDYLESLDTLHVNDRLKRVIRLQQGSLNIQSSHRTIGGIFQSGGYGIESDIINTITSKNNYKKKKDDADTMPFYFLLSVPKDRTIGVLILERIGIYGISTVVKHSIAEFFKVKLRDLTVDFDPLISKELARSFIDDGGVKEIILRRYSLPEDKADKIGLKEYTDSILSVELRIKAKGFFSGFNKRINKYLSDPNAKFFDLPDLKKIGFDEGVNYSVKSDYDGVTRTIDLSDSMQIRPYYDINQEVTKLDSGFSEFKSIHRIAKALLASISSEIQR